MMKVFFIGVKFSIEMNSFKVVFLVLTRKLSLSLSLSLFKNNRQRRSDDQRVTNVHELQDSADENGRGVPGDERKSVDFVRRIAVRVNGGAFNIHENCNRKRTTVIIITTTKTTKRISRTLILIPREEKRTSSKRRNVD